MRKFWPAKVKGPRTQKKTNHPTLQRPILEHPRHSSYVALLLLEFKNYL